MESTIDARRSVAPPQTTPRAVIPDAPMRPSAILVIIGLLFAGLGWVITAAAGLNSDPSTLGLGVGIIWLGGFFFSVGLLVEFFAIGASLRSISRSSDQVVSLLRSAQPPPSV